MSKEPKEPEEKTINPSDPNQPSDDSIYTVIDTLKHDGENLEIGDEVMLDAKTAKTLIALQVIKAI